MNVWRLLGISIFVLAAACFMGTGSFVAGQGKKTDDKSKKADDKSKKADDKSKKADDKTKVEKKPEPKPEPKVTPKAGGETWKFKAFDASAKPFYQEQTTTTKQTIKVMGQEVKQDQSQTFMILWTPLPLDKDKNYVVSQKIVGVKMSIDIGGNRITYDSTAANNPKNPMTDFFTQLMKQELKFTITPALKVKSIEGRKDFISRLSEINPQMKGLLENILSDDALTKMAEPTWWAFPKDGMVSVGQTWTEKSKLDLGPIGTYNTTFDFKYAGKDKIDIKTKLEYTAPTKKEGLPFIIKSATLKSDSGTGEAVFDPTKGRFASTKLKMTLDGDLKIEVGNMETPVTLSQTQDATTLTHDNNPWEKK